MNEVLVALSSPFLNGKLNKEGLINHVESLIKAGVDGFFLLGTTGLGMVMSTDEKREVMNIVKEVAGRKKLIAHVGAAVIDDVINVSRDAARLEFNAVASVPPIYYKPDETTLIRYYNKIREVAGLPVYIYNIPQNSGFNVTPSHAAQMRGIIIGVKDSTGDIGQVAGFVDLGLEVFNGADHAILPSLVVGAHGAVSAMANVVPELEVKLFREYDANNLSKAMDIQRSITKVRDIIKKYPTPAAYYWAASVLRGYELGDVKEPLRTLTDEEKKELKKELNDLIHSGGISL
ncbi:MAG: dihydrodipicolinate synthase family protein [Thermocladium sp.]|jgi:dihydrodipicolinate synthase/N-acetylneuraminate lyase